MPGVGLRLVLAGLLAGTGVLASTGVVAATEGAPPSGAVPAVLVLVPDLTWANAPAVLDGYAKASLSVRSARARTTLADGYLTVGKGAPSAAPRELQPLRAAPSAHGGLVLPDWDRLRAHDGTLRQPGELGRLGAALEASGRPWAAVVGDPAVAATAATTDGEVRAVFPGGAAGLGQALGAGNEVVITGASRAEVAEVLDAAGDACVVVASVSTPEESRHLGVLAASPACGLGRRGLASATTSHDHLATLTDVGPTFLDRAGVERPPSFAGAAVTSTSDVSRAALVARDDKTYAADRARSPLVWLLVALSLGGAITVALAPRARVPVAYGLLSVPAASFLMMLVPWWRWELAGAVLAGGAMCAVLAVAAAAITRSDIALGVGGLALAAAAVVGVDALFGGWLEIDAPFGNSPVTGARFFGVGNIGSGFLAAGLLVAGGIALDRMGARAWPLVSGALAVAVLAGGAPWFGADVGGLLAYVPAYVVLLLGWRDGRPAPRRLVLALGAALAVVALFGALDALRPDDVQSHLGRAVGSGENATDQALRKAERALGTIRSPMALILPIGAFALLAARPRLDGRPALRAAGWALLVAGVAGTVLNDSGLVVGASVMAIAWPAYVALGRLPAPASLEPAESRTPAPVAP